MISNIGDNYRAMRIILGSVIFPSAVLGVPFNLVPMDVSAVYLVSLASIYLLVTGAFGLCPLYGLIRINTAKKADVTVVKSSVKIKPVRVIKAKIKRKRK